MNRYLMFLDERGKTFEGKHKYFSMLGIIFREDYCTQSDDGEYELNKNLNKYKKILSLNSNSSIGTVEFMRNLNFTAMPIVLECNPKKEKSEYETATERLLEQYNSFLIDNKATGGIVIRDGVDKESFLIKQKFLNIYTNKDNILGYESRINSFCIERKNDNTYSVALEVMEALKEILLNDYSDIDEGTTQFETRNKIIRDIKDKTYDGRIKTFLDFELRKVENM